jgi:pyruvate formate lyase activating enzyme
MALMRNLPPTPAATLQQARAETLDAGLKCVYIGNVMGDAGNSTYCPRDGTLLIGRSGFVITHYGLTAQGRCPTCNDAIPGVW